MKDVLITGASSDTGTEILKHLCEKEKDLRVFAHYNRSDAKLRELALSYPETELIPVQADLSDASQTLRMCEELSAKGCSPSVFIYLPAPPFNYMRIKEFEAGALDAAISVGAESFLIMCRSFLPVMKKNGGNVMVMLTSYVTDDLPPKFMTDYIVGKYALLGAMKEAAAEYGSDKLHINGIAPEMMDTAFLDNIDPRIKEMSIANAPAGRLLKPSDLLTDLDKLISPECRINGEILRVSL